MAHTTSFRVRFSEIDPYRHVNHAVYVSWLEAGRVEALEDVGMGLDLLQRDGIQVVITSIEVRFKKPAVAGDVVTIETEVASVRRASSQWRQRVMRGDEELIVADVHIAVCDDTGKPMRPPAGFMDRLTTLGDQIPVGSVAPGLE
ncbi:MAG: acyl-CoA thioesterase [Actinomycetia bacterium]|nr:acyl-CoA thioesterase [Actinomycetes bacterium]MCP4962925.1 acyl-CoA thioesterase [Actinomycetes bacterium]